MATPRFDILAKMRQKARPRRKCRPCCGRCSKIDQGRAGPVDTYLFDLRHQSPGGSIFSVDSMEKNPSEN
jgi:hypothetical protein